MRAHIHSKAPRPSAAPSRYARVLQRMRELTPEERFQNMVDAGIFTQDGKLTPIYREMEAESAEGKGAA